MGNAHETKNKARVGVPEDCSTVRLKENALEFDLESVFRDHLYWKIGCFVVQDCLAADQDLHFHLGKEVWANGERAVLLGFSAKLRGIRQKSEVLHGNDSLELLGRGVYPSPTVTDCSLLRSARAENLGHLPECLVELHILINAVDCSALWHPATVRAAARVVALTASNDVFLNRVKGGPKILGFVSVASRIEKHRRIDGGLREVFPPVSCRASGEGEPLSISQDSILKELHLVHDVRHSTKDFK